MSSTRASLREKQVKAEKLRERPGVCSQALSESLAPQWVGTTGSAEEGVYKEFWASLSVIMVSWLN